MHIQKTMQCKGLTMVDVLFRCTLLRGEPNKCDFGSTTGSRDRTWQSGKKKEEPRRMRSIHYCTYICTYYVNILIIMYVCTVSYRKYVCHMSPVMIVSSEDIRTREESSHRDEGLRSDNWCGIKHYYRSGFTYQNYQLSNFCYHR